MYEVINQQVMKAGHRCGIAAGTRDTAHSGERQEQQAHYEPRWRRGAQNSSGS